MSYFKWLPSGHLDFAILTFWPITSKLMMIQCLFMLSIWGLGLRRVQYHIPVRFKMAVILIVQSWWFCCNSKTIADIVFVYSIRFWGMPGPMSLVNVIIQMAVQQPFRFHNLDFCFLPPKLSVIQCLFMLSINKLS